MGDIYSCEQKYGTSYPAANTASMAEVPLDAYLGRCRVIHAVVRGPLS